MFRLRIFIQILVLVVIQASCNSQETKEKKILKEKVLSIEKDFIKKEILKDNSATSYMNMYINSYSYNYSIEQRLAIRDLLKSHFENEIKITNNNNDTIAMYRYNSNWDSINKHMRKIDELVSLGANDKKAEAYINEYIKQPDNFLRKRLKAAFFENDESKFFSYVSLYLMFKDYEDGDIGFEYWVKRYQVYGDALLDPNFKEDKKVERSVKEEDKTKKNEPEIEIIEVIESTEATDVDENIEIEEDEPEL